MISLKPRLQLSELTPGLQEVGGHKWTESLRQTNMEAMFMNILNTLHVFEEDVETGLLWLTLNGNYGKKKRPPD